MGEMQERITSVLEPYVGPAVAGVCLRAAASAAGKSADTLTSADLPAIKESLRAVLAPVASAEVFESILARIEAGGSR